eukprot:CAMPEP_0198686236 /NCGR_PEP_ID=MMETSP1468-20131203/14665_1 /TAXON_ID=1461545 /ORGANISM="Mantoniella sp, Strain CCMP1436" /LENGTH=360 /DNA_ID=CAMNT_0044432235 /DNA_START=542 /DNA_END=1620 /DNA_ORIENTATION=+
MQHGSRLHRPSPSSYTSDVVEPSPPATMTHSPIAAHANPRRGSCIGAIGYQRAPSASRVSTSHRRIPNAFAHGNERTIQSSLYLTDCSSLGDDTFAFCVGSHKWPDEDNWKVDSDNHSVSVPAESVVDRFVKVSAKEGDLVLWYSTTVHWGHSGVLEAPPARCKKVVTVPLWREEAAADDTDAIRQTLDTHGVCVVPGIATLHETDALKARFVEDANAIFAPPRPFSSWTDVTTVGSGKAGSALPPLTLSRWAWEAKLLPARVSLFRRLLATEDICVGLDSVHWNPAGNRLCSMASFSPRSQRTAVALKLKCVVAAWGRWRTTHWAAHGDLSRFCYGSRFTREHAFARVDPAWKAWASAG